jgi:hypothetical protein
MAGNAYFKQFRRTSLYISFTEMSYLIIFQRLTPSISENAEKQLLSFNFALMSGIRIRNIKRIRSDYLSTELINYWFYADNEGLSRNALRS